jgi:hypothetical protein
VAAECFTSQGPGNANAPWFTETILLAEPRIKTMLGLPYDNLEATLQTSASTPTTPVSSASW